MSVVVELWRFAEMLRKRRLFEAGTPVAMARAPGRLDVMGGIADYSGSLVLERPIAEATCAAVQPLDRTVLEVISLGRTALSIPMAALVGDDGPVAYDVARRRFAHGDER